MTHKQAEITDKITLFSVYNESMSEGKERERIINSKSNKGREGSYPYFTLSKKIIYSDWAILAFPFQSVILSGNFTV